MNWKRFTRRDACPVCNGERHDCRQNLETNLVHCRSNEANPLDYIYRGQDAWNFNMWAYKPDADEWSSDRREEWLEEQQRKRALKEQQEKEQLKKLLPIKERDKVIRAILEQLTLSDAHRQQLKARGLTALQIDEAGYRSVNQWQKLTNPVNNRLSGVNQFGNGLVNKTDGILIPIANENGLYTALRVNNVEAASNGHGKYYWLSSAKRGIKVNLPNGELPITVYFPDKPSQTNQIGLCEGLEYKPLLAAKNLGIPVIGFPGSNFDLSPKTLKALIKKIWTEWICTNSSTTSKGKLNSLNITKTDLLSTATVSADGNPNIYSHSGNQILDGTIQIGEPLKSLEDCGSSEKNYTEQCSIILIADAGVGVNPQISTSHISTMKMIDGWGYDIKLADWGQLEDKENGLDIDEVDTETIEINLISIKSFKEKSDKLIYHQQAFKAWKSCKELTPTKTIEQDYLDLPIPHQNSINGIKSGLGTGKTTNLTKWLKYLEDYGAVSLGYRNSLLLQFAKKAKFTHIHERESSYYIKDSRGKVTACINSHHRFKKDDFDGKLLILDEVVSVLKHLLFSPTVKQRDKAIDLLKQAIIRSSRVVILDGNLADPYIEFIKAVDPTKTIEIVNNTYKGNKPKLVLLDGTIKKTKLRKRDHSPWLYDLITLPNMTGAIASDSQTLLESLDRILSKLGLKVLRVDSKTINKPEVKKFLEDPNKYLEENSIDRLLFSPSCESGLDVNITNYFTHFFGLFYGQLDADSLTQIIARIRDIKVTRYLWINPFTKVDDRNSIKSPFLEKLQYHFNQQTKQDIHLAMAGEDNKEELISEILSKLKEELSSPESKLANRLEAMLNFEKANLRKCVYWLLEQQGYDITNRYTPEEKEPFKKARIKVSKEKIETKFQNCTDIFDGSDKYLDKPWMMLSQDASWEERCALMKAKLIKLLPNIQDSSFWSPELIYLIRYKYPNLITQLENRIYLEKFDQENSPALVKAKKFYHNLLTQVRNSKLCPWKIKPRYLFLKALFDLRLLYFIEVAGEFTADSEPVLELLKRANQKRIWQGLGKRPGKDPIKFVRWLLNQIGYDLDDRRLSDETRTRVYKVIPIKINVKEVIEPHKHDNYVYGVINKLLGVIEARIERDYNLEQLETLRWDNETILQQQFCSTETEEKSNNQTDESKKGCNPDQATRINDPDVPIIVKEDPPHLDQENIVQDEPKLPVKEPLDINIREIESVSEVPIEAVPVEDCQFIADLIKDSQTVEDIKFLRDESGLTIEQLQLGWDLLPSSEKERLRPLFAQLNTSTPFDLAQGKPGGVETAFRQAQQPRSRSFKNPDPLQIGQKIKAQLQHFTGQWMRLIGEVVEFLTDCGERHKQLRTADGSEYPLSCLFDIQPLSWSESIGL